MNSIAGFTNMFLHSLFVLLVLFFLLAFFLKRVSTKIRGSSTTTTNAEVMSIQTDIGDVIEHVQCQLCMCWVTKKGMRVGSSAIKTEFG